MAYYYVKSGGTATGDAGRATTQRTGSFATMGASAYYDSCEAIATAGGTAIAAGDFICISDASAKTHAATTSLHDTDLNMSSTDLPITFITVDDSNADTYAIATSAQEISGGGGDVNWTGASSDDNKIGYHGIWIKSDDDNIGLGNTPVVFFDCTFEVAGAGDFPFRNTASSSQLYNCTMKSQSISNNTYYIYTSNVVRMYGGVMENLQGTPDATLIYAPVDVEFHGVDMSASGISRLVGVNNGKAYRNSLKLVNCELPSSFTDFGSNITDTFPGGRFTLIGCGSSAVEQEYQFWLRVGQSEVEDDSAIYREEAAAFPSGTKISYKCVAGAEATRSMPFVFEIPTRWCEFSTAAQDKLRIHLASTATLTDQDVRVEIIYNDGTNAYQKNWAESNSHDPFATGTTLTTSTTTWKNGGSDLAGYNEYQIDVDTSGDTGANCAPLIRVFVSTADTIYICSTVEVL